jgi:hypothetical protein
MMIEVIIFSKKSNLMQKFHNEQNIKFQNKAKVTHSVVQTHMKTPGIRNKSVI